MVQSPGNLISTQRRQRADSTVLVLMQRTDAVACPQEWIDPPALAHAVQPLLSIYSTSSSGEQLGTELSSTAGQEVVCWWEAAGTGGHRPPLRHAHFNSSLAEMCYAVSTLLAWLRAASQASGCQPHQAQHCLPGSAQKIIR